jgi:hypothetical protein
VHSEINPDPDVHVPQGKHETPEIEYSSSLQAQKREQEKK